MDREKVIKGLQDAEISLRGFANHFPPLREECHEQADACHDALALLEEQEDEIAKFCGEVARLTAMLKEQEAVEPSWQNGKMYCGHCGPKFPPRVGMRFCHRCGMPIKLKVNDIVDQEGR